MAIIKKGKMRSVGEGVEKLEPSCTADDNVNGRDSVEQFGGS